MVGRLMSNLKMAKDDGASTHKWATLLSEMHHTTLNCFPPDACWESVALGTGQTAEGKLKRIQFPLAS